MVTIEPKEIDVKLNLVGLNVYEEQITRINQKLEKANSLANELAKKDADVSVESLVEQLSEKIAKLDEFEKANILFQLIEPCGSALARMILVAFLIGSE
ncbi:hypothetical protein [uncultured Dubosiella sp.]|uniref:hypothetical protein n=1 Tax=uncultured Dubosiella sp. TaxID=1937011 RepID=UPI00258F132F|nr:hypothetical protein [uncultured Dubosiella sp.]